jgi:hypothetical protein
LDGVVLKKRDESRRMPIFLALADGWIDGSANEGENN